jgi:Domain of unknown function (DUF1877)
MGRRRVEGRHRQGLGAIHRCLTDGTLDPDGGEYPLSHAVLGGRHLHDDYYVVYVSLAEVPEVAALRGVDRTGLRRRFDAIDDPDYRGAHDDADSSTPGTASSMSKRSTAEPPPLHAQSCYCHLNQDQMGSSADCVRAMVRWSPFTWRVGG